MAAKFYYYPYPAGNRLETITLDDGLAEMFSEFRKDADGGTSLDGASYRSVGLTQEIITIQRDRFKGGENLGHQLRALQNHLDRGYTCSFSADDTKSFCGYLLTSPCPSGSTSIQISGNPFASFVGSNILAADDFIVMETQPPAAIAEENKIASVAAGFTSSSGGTLTLDRGCSFRYEKDTWIRWHRFLPIARRPIEDIGRSIVTNEHGLLYSLEIRLIIDYAGWFAFIPAGPEKIQESVVFPDAGGTPFYESGLTGLDRKIYDLGYERRKNQVPDSWGREDYYSADGPG